MSVLNVIENCFEKEFYHLRDKFEFNELEKSVNRTDEKYKIATKPGVYIICCENKILKIGRHFENAVKRAFEHFRDNTGEINKRTENKITKIFVYNIKNKKDDFWLASLEIFLENNLDVEIVSKRKG